MSLPHQDWTPVIVRKNTGKTTTGQTVPKHHVNKSTNVVKVEKIWDPNDPDAEPETKPVLVGRELGQQIQKARTAKGMTQKELACALNMPVGVINDYERGTGVHNSSFISKIKKYLGITK